MDYFIKGLYEDKLKTALPLHTTPSNANKLLADAVEVQTKLVTIAGTNQQKNRSINTGNIIKSSNSFKYAKHKQYINIQFTITITTTIT
jgi:hypothetical protein